MSIDLSVVLHIDVPPVTFFFFNDPAPTEISSLSLHDALPICGRGCRSGAIGVMDHAPGQTGRAGEIAGHITRDITSDVARQVTRHVAVDGVRESLVAPNGLDRYSTHLNCSH